MTKHQATSKMLHQMQPQASRTQLTLSIVQLLRSEIALVFSLKFLQVLAMLSRERFSRLLTRSTQLFLDLMGKQNLALRANHG